MGDPAARLRPGRRCGHDDAIVEHVVVFLVVADRRAL
jgi:hypothetical protein